MQDERNGNSPDTGEVHIEGWEEKPARHVKTPYGVLVTLLLAAALCAMGFLLNSLSAALRPDADEKKGAADTAGSADTGQYLKAIPWEKKSHQNLKPLGKIKNLRYALEFFQKYTPGEIAALPAKTSTLADTFSGYSGEAGKIVSLQATVVQKYPLAEEIGIRTDAPSTMLSLKAADTAVTASLLVVGSTLDSLKAGDSVKFRCIPFFCYAPDQADGCLFLITLPALVEGS